MEGYKTWWNKKLKASFSHFFPRILKKRYCWIKGQKKKGHLRLQNWDSNYCLVFWHPRVFNNRGKRKRRK